MQQISRDKLDRLLRANPEFTFCAFDRYGLRDQLPARPTLTPEIRFLYIGSSICSTLPSDPASRRRPCASLSLHLYQVVKRTFTSKLSNMHGVQHKVEPLGSSSGVLWICLPAHVHSRKSQHHVAAGRCSESSCRFKRGENQRVVDLYAQRV